MIAKKNIEHIKEKMNECAAKAAEMLTWIETGDGDGNELADELWNIIGFDRDGHYVHDSLLWSLNKYRDGSTSGYENGIWLIYNACVEDNRNDPLPKWVKDGMRENYTDMLSTVYGVERSEIDADVNVISAGERMLHYATDVACDARNHGVER